MGHRTLAFVIGVTTALTAQVAAALGLGEIRLNSTLNQPLNAEIQLLQVRDLSEPEILVGLASLEDFRRVGVERPFFLSDLRFNVDLDNADGPVVRVTSSNPVREPYLNFVVQAQWPSGRLLREYTLLMDLPTFADEQQAQPVQPSSQAGVPGPQASDAREAPRQQQAQTQERPTARTTGGTTYGPVKATDTLWDIAAAARPDRSISVQQAMIAIQRANPGAFINNNINLLREGQVLRIPDRGEMTQLSAREAINEVAYQNQRWSGRGQGSEQPQQAQLEGSQSFTRGREESVEPEGRVKLASPEEYASSSEGRGTGDGGGSTDALENELAATLEELDKTRSENDELRSRIAAMEEQIETMERLVDVSSEEMRALQLASEQAREAAEQGAADEEPVAGPEEPTGTVDDEAEPTATADGTEPSETRVGEPAETPIEADESGSDTGAEAGAGANSSEVETAQEEAVEPVRDPRRVVQTAPRREETLLDVLIDNILYVALGLAVLLGGLVLFLRSRRDESETDEYEDFLVEPAGDFQTEADENNLEESGVAAHTAVAEDDAVQAAPAEWEEEHAEQETEDAVAEAEIYIALAKYDQAEEILLRALENQPQDADMRLKLLELYATQQDLENFDTHYARLRVLDNPEATDRAEELREKIAGAPAFDESAHDTAQFAALAGGGRVAADDEEDEGFGDLDLDLGLDLDETKESGEETAWDEDLNKSLNDVKEDEFADFDLDLGEDFGAADESASENEPVTLNDPADDLDFDFELDIEEENEAEVEETKPAEEMDLSDEFAFDLGLDEAAGEGSADDATAVRPAVADEADDLEALDFDFDLDEEGSPSAVDAGATENTQSEALAGDEELPEAWTGSAAEEDTLEDAFAASPTKGDESQEDDLNIDADMDLSALDEELDALTSDLELDGADVEEPGAEESTEESVEAMDEPMVDFDDLDELSDVADSPSASGTPSWQEDLESLDSDLGEETAPSAEETAAAPVDAEAETSAPNADALPDYESVADFELDDIDPEAEDDSDLDFLSDSDEIATKLDLARAYIDMGDQDGAKDILEEIIQEGSDEQRKEARDLLERV